MNKSIAFFDFDGTLTTRDSLLDFIFFSNKPIIVLIKSLKISPYMLLYKIGMIAPDKAKQKVLISFFGGKPTRIIDNIAIRYAKDRIPSILRSKAISKLLWHKSQGHKVVIVSASPSIWIKPWADLMEVSLISTKIKIIKHKYTGEIEGKNCNGEQKALCIKKRYNLHDYTDIYAYGDSKGDKQMLNLADHAFYNNF